MAIISNSFDVFKTNINSNTLARYYNSLKTVKEHFEGIPIQNINKRMYQAFLNEYGKTIHKHQREN